MEEGEEHTGKQSAVSATLGKSLGMKSYILKWQYLLILKNFVFLKFKVYFISV